METDINLKCRAIIGDIINMSSDVLDIWNIENRPRSQYMHRYREMEKKISEILSSWPLGFVSPYHSVIKDLLEIYKTSPRVTKETEADFSKKILKLLTGKYGYKPTRTTLLEGWDN